MSAPLIQKTPLLRPTWRWRGVMLGVVLLAVWFAGLQSRSLFEPDEGRYAEIAREMFASGDWVMPRFDGFKFYDKPPLQYWATALNYQLFGVHHWTARLWSASAGLLCVLATWYAARRVWGAREGRLSGLVCAGMFLIVAAAHITSLDMGVAAFLTAALCAFLIAEFGCDTPASQRRWMLLTWLAMGLAVLSKGLIGIVLPGGALFVYLLWKRDWTLLRRVQLLPGLALLLVVTVPWFVLLARRDDQFLSFFFIHEHFGRFLSKVANRNQPWWYYLPIAVVGLLPWTGFLLQALRVSWQRARQADDNAAGLVLIYATVVLLFFSLSGAKLPLYVLPMFPALALLIGRTLPRLKQDMIARRLLWIAIPAVLGAGIALALPLVSPLGPQAAYSALLGPVAVAMAMLAIGTGLGVALARRGRVDVAIAAAAIGGLLFAQGLLFAYQRLSPNTSAQTMATLAKPYIRADAPVYAVQMFYRGLPFYLQRPVTLVDERPYDLLAGIDWEPALQIPDLAGFATAWAAHPGAVAFMPPATLQTLSALGLPLHVVARTGDTIIVRNDNFPAH
jgi:4-amino-4-deoxy-L-arabinose transferase-like glycosyltransferase